jgi:ATP-binding cassette, subfamily C, type I secretion system permease/ATPase
VELTIANWKGFVTMRQSLGRLNELLVFLPKADYRLNLPTPNASLSVENVSTCPPGEARIVVDDIAFHLKAGDSLG